MVERGGIWDIVYIYYYSFDVRLDVRCSFLTTSGRFLKAEKQILPKTFKPQPGQD